MCVRFVVNLSTTSNGIEIDHNQEVIQYGQWVQFIIKDVDKQSVDGQIVELLHYWGI